MTTYQEALAYKDAEIARLTNDLTFVSTSATIRGKSILASFRIIRDLKHRIAELEKLTKSQKGTIDAQGKALREAQELVLPLLEHVEALCNEIGREGD